MLPQIGNGIQEVRGSTPLGSTSKINSLVALLNFASHLIVITRQGWRCRGENDAMCQSI
jgi:hypothetical protein